MSATSFAVSFLYFICLNSSILLSKTTAENRLPSSDNDNTSLLTNTESKTKTEVVSVKLMQRLKESLQLARLLAPTRHSNDFVVDNGDSEAESNVLDAYWESNWRSENGSNEFELSNRVEADAEALGGFFKNASRNNTDNLDNNQTLAQEKVQVIDRLILRLLNCSEKCNETYIYGQPTGKQWENGIFIADNKALVIILFLATIAAVILFSVAVSFAIYFYFQLSPKMRHQQQLDPMQQISNFGGAFKWSNGSLNSSMKTKGSHSKEKSHSCMDNCSSISEA